MADPNNNIPFHDEPYNTPYTLNPYLLDDSPLIPLSNDKGKEIMDIGSSDDMDDWDFYSEFDMQSFQDNPFGINGETSNQIETNLGNESLNNQSIPTVDQDLAIRESFPFPLSNPQSGDQNEAAIYIGSILEDPLPKFSQSDLSKIVWEMSNQTETSIRNGSVNNPNVPTPEEIRGKSAIDPLQKTSNAVNLQTISLKTYNGETRDQRDTNLRTQSLDNTNSRQLSVWPSIKVPFGCSSCCQILRKITHMKGGLAMTLQIHGRFPEILFHAILDEQLSAEVVSHKTFDFYGKSMNEVKQFLTQYFIDRKQEGYTMLKDPHSTFFEILCTGLDFDENLPDGDYTEKTLSPDQGNIQMDEAANDNDNQEQSPFSQAEDVVATASDEAENNNNKEKSTFSLKEQRKRVKDLTVNEILPFFHLPIKKAAKKLGFSVTIVYSTLSKNGCGRWPYRKINSKQKEISGLKPLLNSDDPYERDRATKEIRRKEEEISQIYKEAIIPRKKKRKLKT
ncbi:hypothetical protein REPUB_Repub03eG0044800 [Reevesia pubescens]